MTESNSFERIVEIQEAVLSEADQVEPTLPLVRQRLQDRIATVASGGRASASGSRGAHGSGSAISAHVGIRRVVVVAMAAAAILGVAFVQIWRTVPSASSESVRPVSSRWVFAPVNESQRMHFADGSQVVFLPGASGRMLQLDETRMRVTLEKGSLEMEIQSTRKTDWLVEAGPYQVTVTGTRFDVSWDTATQQFDLALLRGSVWVQGPMVEDGRSVTASHRLQASVLDGRLEVSPMTPSASEVPVAEEDDEVKNGMMPDDIDDPQQVPNDGERRDRRGSARSSIHAEPETGRAPSWTSFNRQGAFQRVMEEASREGISSVISGRPLEDVMALADAARLTRNRTVAGEAYTGVRHRFPDSSQANTAAFYLGMIAFDQYRSYREAIRWLSVYLEAHGNQGPFSREAVGRLLEAYRRTGNEAAARRYATLYLQNWQGGPHEAAARKLLEESTP